MAIFAMWAVVLVPMWWKKQEQIHPTRSIDRFNGVMRSLSGEVGAITPSLGTLTPVERRRRVFAVLTGLLLVTTIAVVAGAPFWMLLIPASLLGGFVYAARAQVERERISRSYSSIRARAMAEHPAGTGRARRSLVLESIPEPAIVEPAKPIEAPVRGVRYDEQPQTWAPAPTTLPTYVSAPAATRVPRVIDLKTPGSWSAQAMLREAQQQRLTPEIDEPAPIPVQTFTDLDVDDVAPVPVVDEVDERLEQILRRVVNE